KSRFPERPQRRGDAEQKAGPLCVSATPRLHSPGTSRVSTKHTGYWVLATAYFFNFPLSSLATRARVARRRKRTEKQVSQVVLNHSPSLPQEPSSCWNLIRRSAPSAYQKWSPIFSVPK